MATATEEKKIACRVKVNNTVQDGGSRGTLDEKTKLVVGEVKPTIYKAGDTIMLTAAQAAAMAHAVEPKD